MAVFRDLVSRVSRACGVYARSGPRRAWVRVKLVDGKIDRVLLLEPDVPVLLAGCLTGELRGQPFVHPVEGEDTFAIQF